VRVLAAFIYDRSDRDEFEPEDTLAMVLMAMWDAVGSRPGKRLNSLALIGKRIVASIYNLGDCHGGRFYRHATPYVVRADRPNQSRSPKAIIDPIEPPPGWPWGWD